MHSTICETRKEVERSGALSIFDGKKNKIKGTNLKIDEEDQDRAGSGKSVEGIIFGS